MREIYTTFSRQNITFEGYIIDISEFCKNVSFFLSRKVKIEFEKIVIDK